MTEEQKKWFDKLAKKRKKFAELSQDPDYKGMWEVLIKGIYSEDAHFVYELLQNAEDVNATYVKFILKEDGLYFIHNGTIPFTITDIDNYNENGHINAITAVGRTGKKVSETIGKFGIGFKAVFQYTKTPHIYDSNFQFKIEDYIVPALLNNYDLGIEYNKQLDTVFYFPFIREKEQTDNNKVKSKSEAYKDISEKLNDLDNPSLFLSNLNKITWIIGSESNTYVKKIISSQTIGNLKYERIILEPQNTEYLIFTRSFSDKSTIVNLDFSYSIGFQIKDSKLKPLENSCAYCFFPTKQKTNLNFVIHAPFLLNSNREAIPKNQSLKLKDDHNVEHIIKENFNEFLMGKLSQLAADSLIVLEKLKLIDDDIVKIIPYKQPEEDDFYELFYDAIKETFKSEDLLPAKNSYVGQKNAYWAQDNPVFNVFSDKQLALLIDEENAKWVFRNLVRNKTGKDEELRDYIDDCTKAWYDMSDLLRYSINASFIENQTYEWLHKFYEYLSKNNSYWNDVKTKPIFLNKEKKAVPAFEKRNNELHEILFLPSSSIKTSSKTIDPILLENKKTSEFIENFGLKKPSLKDEIYNRILPLYNTDKGIDTRPHFELFFKYWKEDGRPEDFLNLIRDKAFVLYRTNENETQFRGEGRELYYPSSELQGYFETKPDTKFVDLETYYGFITTSSDKQLLKEFLIKLGVKEVPRILEEEITDSSIKLELGLEMSTYGYHDRNETFDKIIDGCREILEQVDKVKSMLLWMYLGKLQYKIQRSWNNEVVYSLKSELKGKHKYFSRTQYQQSFESTTLKLLRTKKWLLSKYGRFVAPNEITINELAEEYDANYDLETLLGFKPLVVLTENERIAQKFKSEEEAEEARIALEEKRAKENASRAKGNNDGDRLKDNYTEDDEEEMDISGNKRAKSSKMDRVIEDLNGLLEELSSESKPPESIGHDGTKQPSISFNEDEELAKGLDIVKKQVEEKKYRKELLEKINETVKYSYEWFEAYLLLLTTYGEKQNNQKQKSIAFQEIKPYKADNKYFLLCGASSYFTSDIEHAEDFKISLVFGNGVKENITVEGVSKKGQDLLIYCRESMPIKILSRLSQIFKVEINFTPVIDLLDRLYKAFSNAKFVDEWQSIEDAMPPLNYIFGPPGTGKTTTLCNQIKKTLLTEPRAKFLVLTPTNKAADVVCKKLWDIDSNIFAIRLSRPTDPELEEEAIYREVLDFSTMIDVNVVASTIHRLPYFDIKNNGLLFQYKWDYVIFDESSMTGLHYITFALMALFKSKPAIKFIVAGDPKQIPPVVDINDKELENFEFQDENIYKMMKLESFNPKNQNIRRKDTISNLDTQYRSIPKIGQLFSELSYDGLLKHNRATNGKESKSLPEKFRDIISSNVTFIDVSLNQENSIYKIGKLINSSYQVYSGLLVAEIIKFFDSNNNSKDWTIGLIAPYKAQAVLLNKLITSYGISENVKVYSDTVHGFQGDECDIVFFICNPNNYNYTGHKMSLLSKEYIYNVAISRARDYLVILHPYTSIGDNRFINKIASSYKRNFGNSKIIKSSEVEKVLFGEENYIEHNSYVSGHDNVNVFGLSDMKYFIKSNDTAIDIQLRDINEKKGSKVGLVESNLRDTELPKLPGIKVVGHLDLNKLKKLTKDELK